LTGRVKSIKDYGAFLDLGGIDGFLHIGQMSWVRIQHPSEILTQGQDVEVKVLSVDKEKKKIGLGMRQLSANPWTTAEAKYAKGSTVTGRVTRTEPFGAFVELEPGVEGLVHISELDHKRVRRVTEVLNVDQTATVQVLEVDPQKKRISLSLKALMAKPDEPQEEAVAPAAGPVYERKRKEPLRGGIGGTAPGGLFGDPRKFT
jgi:small subunit ribosomal protein S1